jgi:hypothetical protein
MCPNCYYASFWVKRRIGLKVISCPFPTIVFGIVTSATVSQAIAKRDAVDGADGRERDESFHVEDVSWLWLPGADPFSGGGPF